MWSRFDYLVRKIFSFMIAYCSDACSRIYIAFLVVNSNSVTKSLSRWAVRRGHASCKPSSYTIRHKVPCSCAMSECDRINWSICDLSTWSARIGGASLPGSMTRARYRYLLHGDQSSAMLGHSVACSIGSIVPTCTYVYIYKFLLNLLSYIVNKWTLDQLQRIFLSSWHLSMKPVSY